MNRSFAIFRVPAIMSDDKEYERRPDLGPAPVVVGYADDEEAAAQMVSDFSRKDARHHYYGLTLRIVGEPGREARIVGPAPKSTGKRAAAPPTGAPRLEVVRGQKEGKS